MILGRKTTDSFENCVLKNVKFDVSDNKVNCTINQCGVVATYPLPKCCFEPKAKAVLMDLDGTSVQSEEFWIYLMEKTAQTLAQNKKIVFTDEDIPFVSGFSTIEHLSYCIKKFGLKNTISEANACYHSLAEFELKEIMAGRGNIGAFKPRKNLKDFLLELKANDIKIGLATSGLDYKAIPEILSVFRQLNMGDPVDFYDAIVIGGKRKIKGQYGTLGELSAKPHPWVYAEIGMALVGENKNNVITLEDSSSGLISSRLAGYSVIGFDDGNIEKSGLVSMCYDYVPDFEKVLKIIL